MKHRNISDEYIRENKVRKVKTKILSEIDGILKIYKKEICENISDENFEFYVKQIFALLKLKEYIEDEHSFMSYEIKNYNNNIIYTVSDKNLEIWLQQDYSFAIKFLSLAADINYNVYPLLNDEYFAHRFINICEKILYDKKKGNENA